MVFDGWAFDWDCKLISRNCAPDLNILDLYFSTLILEPGTWTLELGPWNLELFNYL
jgi:hypothetical protein